MSNLFITDNYSTCICIDHAVINMVRGCRGEVYAVFVRATARSPPECWADGEVKLWLVLADNKSAYSIWIMDSSSVKLYYYECRRRECDYLE